jgi:NADH-quinone oxidoreductase subunit L
MRIVLAILAVLVVATGFIIEGPASNFFSGDTGYSLIHVVLVPFLCAIGAIILGLGLAYLFYGKGQTEVGFVEKINVFKALRTFVANGFYIDHLYNLVFVKPVFWIGQKLSFFKTGKINWNMIFGSVVAIFIVVATLLVVMV